MRKTTCGMIGGGGKAFIFHVHQRAQGISRRMEIVCAAAHENREIAIAEAGKWWGDVHGYRTWQEMIDDQAELSPDDPRRMQFVAIVTPNFAHYEPAKAALEAGFPVLCEKPLTMTVEEAETLRDLARARNIPFMVAHTYIGHHMARFLRWLVKEAKVIGDIRRIRGGYGQDWLIDLLEKMGVQQAEWRTDPARAGVSGCGGDIASHVQAILRYITGLEVKKIRLADLTTFVTGRQLDDDFYTYCIMSNGAKAVIEATQIGVGHSNDLVLEITGTKGTVRWRQEESEKVVLNLVGWPPDLTYWRGRLKEKDPILGELPPWLVNDVYDPSGHCEGLEHALAHMFDGFAEDVERYWSSGGKELPQNDGERYPGVDYGVSHMQFIHAAKLASQTEAPVTL